MFGFLHHVELYQHSIYLAYNAANAMLQPVNPALQPSETEKLIASSEGLFSQGIYIYIHTCMCTSDISAFKPSVANTYTENSSKETEVIEPWPEEAEAGRVSLSPLALALLGRSSCLICSERNGMVIKCHGYMF